MAFSTRTIGILISLVLSAVMITGAFIFSGSNGPLIADAQSTEALLRAYAEQDTDADLLLDWQEKLYGSDPTDPYSLDPDMTDREAVDSGKVKPKFESDAAALDVLADEYPPGIEAGPQTLTDRFARELFENYLTENGTGSVPTGEALLSFVDEQIGTLSSEAVRRNAYTASSIRKVPGGADALRAYAVAAEAVGKTYGSQAEKSEILYFSDAIQTNDLKALAMVRTIGESYGKMGDAFIALPVPEEAASAHLRAANALARMSAVIADMGTFDTDPMLGLVGLGSYEAAAYELAHSLAELHKLYVSAQIVITPGEPGYLFYQLMEYAGTETKN